MNVDSFLECFLGKLLMKLITFRTFPLKIEKIYAYF